MRLLDHLVARALPCVPRAVVWRVASRYIAGMELDDAARVIRSLRAEGLSATVDYLGESVTRREEAEAARDAYLRVLDRLAEGDLPAGISVKLTQMGLGLDPAFARANVEALVERAAPSGRFVRIDMEDSSTTGATIAIYRELRARHQNVGMVLQAYLRRTLEDARSLLPLGPDIRVCKGIYREPASLAFQEFGEVQRNFLAAVRLLLEGGAKVAIATHDPDIIEGTFQITRELGVGPERHQYQMLLGVGKHLWERIRSRGGKLRIYVPFGRSWYAYSLRRLRENPQVAGHVFRNLFAFR